MAFWDRRIGDDEIHMFLGGYSEIQNPMNSFKPINDKVNIKFYPEASFDNVDVSELVGMTTMITPLKYQFGHICLNQTDFERDVAFKNLYECTRVVCIKLSLSICSLTISFMIHV